jgi:catechol 2,3-dioxygenase-like lactoylglutathione lyase family enzyme
MSFSRGSGRNRIDTPEKGVQAVGESLKSVGAITMFVEDRARSKAFYERVFDVSILNEDDVSIAFKFDNLIVNLLEASGAPELIEPAPVASAESGSRFQLTIWVDDTDTVCAELGIARRRAAERPDRPRLGRSHGGVRRSGRPRVGGRGQDPRLTPGSLRLGVRGGDALRHDDRPGIDHELTQLDLIERCQPDDGPVVAEV